MIYTKNRTVKTKLPHNKTESYLQILRQYEPDGMVSSLPVIWKKAKGYSVWDIFGNKFIDFTSTIFVTNSGHGGISNAIKNQADELIHCYNYPNLPRIQLIKKLKKLLPHFCEKIYLASTGSEVTDWATKLMRHYGKKSNRNIIISYIGSFHGKVGDAAKLENQELRLPLPESDEDWELHKKLIKKVVKKCCGIMIESYQGWNARFLPEKYIQNLVDFCKEHDIIVCFDEIQGGFYRTGTKFAYNHYQVQPDLICLGKALGGGVPISALCGRAKLFTGVEGMSSTHSANPLCCAGAHAALEILEELNKNEFYLKQLLLIKYLDRLSNHYKITIHGRGFLYGLIFENKEIADQICYDCMQNGLLVVRTGKESIKIGPPLTISESALLEGLRVLENSIKKILKG